MSQFELRKQRVFFALFRLSAFAGVIILVLVLGLLLQAGFRTLSWQFLTSPWQHQNIAAGGIMPAIVGSFYIGVGVALVSLPLGIATAIYLTEYGRTSYFRHVIQLAIRNLAGVPSVVYGLFGLAVFVHFFRFGSSLLAAILTLSAMTLPWVITAAVEALEAVPDRFRASSLALGATQWQTIWRVVLPAAIAGMLTGGVLGIARAMGETAPIIFVGATFFLTKLPSSVLDNFMALPYHTFILATQHANAQATQYAAGTALVLIALTVALSVTAILIRYFFRRRKDW